MTGVPIGVDRDPRLNGMYSSVLRRCGRFGVGSLCVLIHAPRVISNVDHNVSSKPPAASKTIASGITTKEGS